MSKTGNEFRKWIWAVLLGVGVLAGGMMSAQGAFAAAVPTKSIDKGIAERMNGARPRPLDMVSRRPEGIHKLPANLAAPLYGVLTLGLQEAPTRFATVLDGAGANGEPRLWIDANADGDLTDDAPILWKKFPYQTFDGKH